MKNRLIRLFKLPTTRDVLINTLGNYMAVFFVALYAIILFRIMPIAEYGVFSVLFAIAYLLANILDFGVTASIYSYLPELQGNRKATVRFIKTNFVFQTVLVAIVLFVSYFFIDLLDSKILKLDVPSSYYFWTFISIPFFIWQNFVLNVLFATKRFLYGNILNNIAYVTKLLLLFFLILTDNVTPETVIIAFGIVSQVIFFAILIHHKRSFFWQLLHEPLEWAQVRLTYTLTFFASSQLFNLASRIDLFMLSYFLTKTEVGYYGLAQKIILTVLTMINSITQVLSPQFAAAKTKQEVISLLKKGMFYMMLPTSMFLLLIVLPQELFVLAFKEKVTRAVAITRLLAAPYTMYGLTAIPVLFFLYTIKKPVHLLIINFIFLVVVSIGCFIFIPIYGVNAPPMVFAAAFIIAALYIVVFFIKELRMMKE